MILRKNTEKEERLEKMLRQKLKNLSEVEFNELHGRYYKAKGTAELFSGICWITLFIIVFFTIFFTEFVNIPKSIIFLIVLFIIRYFLYKRVEWICS